MVLDYNLIKCRQIISIECLISHHILSKIICSMNILFLQSNLFRYKCSKLNQQQINPQTTSNQQQNIQESVSVQIKKQKLTPMKPSDKNVNKTNHNQNSLRMKMKMIFSKRVGGRGSNLNYLKYKYCQSKKSLFSTKGQFKLKIQSFVHRFHT